MSTELSNDLQSERDAESASEESEVVRDQTRPLMPGEGVFGVLLLILALIMFWQAYGIAGFTALSSPGAFPMAAAAAMVVGSLTVLLQYLIRRRGVRAALADKARAFSAEITPTVVIIFTGFVIGYAGLLDTLGFLPASFLFLLVGIYFLHRGSLLFTLVVSVLSLIVIYAVFRLVFSVILPEGIVPEDEILAWFERLFSRGGEQP